MAKLGNPKNTIEILNKYDFQCKRSLVKTFNDTHVLEKIVRAEYY